MGISTSELLGECRGSGPADGTRGVDGDLLVNALRVLGRHSGAVPRGERDRAAQVLLSEMAQWAPSVIWKAHRRSLRDLATGEPESLIADAVQALALVASSASCNFRGENVESARAWCRRVLLSEVSNELRLRQARRKVLPADLAGDGVAHVASEEDEAGSKLDALDRVRALADTLAMLRQVRASIFATHRPRDAETTIRAIWCYLAYLAGATLDEQVRALRDQAGESECEPHGRFAERRYRNRVYKLRERGRRALNQTIRDAHADSDP